MDKPIMCSLCQNYRKPENFSVQAERNECFTQKGYAEVYRPYRGGQDEVVLTCRNFFFRKVDAVPRKAR
jgi:hypothetical protein